jgi:hypothetical protein
MDMFRVAAVGVARNVAPLSGAAASAAPASFTAKQLAVWLTP